MAQAFYTGINGIQTHQKAIDVVADNLSNISTVGFRGYRAEFTSLLEKAISSSSDAQSNTIGIGARINAITMDDGIGSFSLTDRSTDLALLGDGWFGIQGEGNPIYTRDGSFTFDKNRDLVTADGLYVLGTMGGNISNGVLTEQLSEVKLGAASAQEKLQLPTELIFPVQPTTQVNFYGNLGVEDETKVMSAKAIDAQNNKNAIRLEFTKAVPQVLPGSQWNVTATAQSTDYLTTFDPATNMMVSTPKEVYDTQTGIVSFDASGLLLSSTIPTMNNNGSPVSVNLGGSFGGIVSTDNPFSASSQSDGVEEGTLAGYDINKNAEIIAAFTNGMQSSVGTIAVFHFANDKGLERVNGSRFTESANSGKPIFFTDTTGQNIIGTDITNYKLEGSNVTMDSGLTELIVLQRSYDANSKSITTADQMLQKALEMDAK